MDLGLKGKSVLVSAASKGLGKATALEYAREGAIVTIASRNFEQLQQTAEEIKRITGQAVTCAEMDITRAEDVENAVSTAVSAGGGLDVLVYNAGGPPAGMFDQFDDAQWQKAFELNLLSAVRMIRASLPHMRAKGAGRIITLTSSSIKQPINGLILSNTIRTGVYGLTKSLAAELANDQILVNTVAPGRIETDRILELDAFSANRQGISVEELQSQSFRQIPVGRYGTPEEFARAVVFLGSFANTYITGQALLVDGGMVKGL
ncbi:SDR family oxidoreductase [Fodinisporobacter ferrooxydans]|uniref:SDR family oxidoreductase n=1 Tax=Fodinisporobacter ferrooxydans TaxID=2901836 RepID=A0ABY4CK25_9BACL|nr:SDR family oxidoreductase [Alicyclobacillaceae bacterium MYW30-H2]